MLPEQGRAALVYLCLLAWPEAWNFAHFIIIQMSGAFTSSLHKRGVWSTDYEQVKGLVATKVLPSQSGLTLRLHW